MLDVKRNFLTPLLFLLFSTVVYANGGSFVPPPPPPVVHSGILFLGVGVGGDFADNGTWTRTRFDELDGNDIFTLITPKHFTWTADGVKGKLFLGYGYTLHERVYLGVEGWGAISSLYGSFSKSSIDTRFDPITMRIRTIRISVNGKLESHYAVGVSFVPGILVNKLSMVYFRIGWTARHFRVRGLFNGVDPFIEGRPLTAYHYNKWRQGIQLGIGFATMITPTWGVRIEGDWSRYQNITQTIQGLDAVGNLFAANLKIRPRIYQVHVGVFYNFFA